VRNDAGSIHRILGVCIDDTDRKQAEDAVRQSLDEIAHLDRVTAMGGSIELTVADSEQESLEAICLECLKRSTPRSLTVSGWGLRSASR
jgi:hypothetical protein